MHFNDLCHAKLADESLMSHDTSINSDPRLFNDDKDIKFSRTLNSCKLPQIRYATKARLFERLTDLRFLSIDFLNTFLLTYRVYTTGNDVLDSLKRVHYNALNPTTVVPTDKNEDSPQQDSQQQPQPQPQPQPQQNQQPPQLPARQSTNSSASNNQNAKPQKASAKPQVPPRSPNSKDIYYCASQAATDNGSMPKRNLSTSRGSNLMLQLPAPHQKRRSTIITLTPITGSSCSLATQASSPPSSPNRDRPKILPPLINNNDNIFEGLSQPNSPIASNVSSAQNSPALRNGPSGSCSIRLSPDNSDLDSDFERSKQPLSAELLGLAERQHRARSFSFSPSASNRKSRTSLSPAASPPRSPLQSPSIASPGFASLGRAPLPVSACCLSQASEPHWRLIRRRELQLATSSKQQMSASNLELAASASCNVAARGQQMEDSLRSVGLQLPSLARSLQNLNYRRSEQALSKKPLKLKNKASDESSTSHETDASDNSKENVNATKRRVARFALKEIEFAESHACDDTSADDDKLASSDDSLSPPVTPSGRRFQAAVSVLAPVGKSGGSQAARPAKSQRPAPPSPRRSTPKAEPTTTSSKTGVEDKQCQKTTASASPEQPQLASRQRTSNASEATQALSAECCFTPRYSVQLDSILGGADSLTRAGVVVTAKGPNIQSRRSSTTAGASAFAAATAASSNPMPPQSPLLARNRHRNSQFGVEYDSGLSGCQLVSPPSSLRLYQQQQAAVAARQRALQCASPLRNRQTSDFGSPFDSRASSRLSSIAGIDASLASSCNTFSATSNLSSAQRASIRQTQQVCSVHGARTNSASQQQLTNSSLRVMATARVLSVLRHWISKHEQDFGDPKLAQATLEFLHELASDANIVAAQHKAAVQLAQTIYKISHKRDDQRMQLDLLLAPPPKPSPDTIETLSALEIAETMTYLDHKIFLSIRGDEFLNQAWMKNDKAVKSPHILLITKRFNDVSRLVSSEIVRVPDLTRRVAIIEKWTNVAHICRVLHNFNGVLQICAAFTNSSVFRLKKTWDKIPKTVSF